MLKIWLSLFLVIISLNTYAQISYHPNRFNTNQDSTLIDGGTVTNLQAANLVGQIPQTSLPVTPVFRGLVITNSDAYAQDIELTFVNSNYSIPFGHIYWATYLESGEYYGVGAAFSFIDDHYHYASLYASNLVAAGVIIGNAAGEYNFSGLGATNSATTYLPPNTFIIVPKFGLISCSLIVTNATTVYLTNAITHYAIPMGGVFGLGTNYANAVMLVNGSDVVAVTNLDGTGGYTLLSSSFQGIQ